MDEIKSKGFKFIELMLFLSKKLFSYEDYDKIEEMSKNLKKSIMIDNLNLAYLYESV